MLSVGSEVFKQEIRDLISQQICNNVRREINLQLNSQLVRMPSMITHLCLTLLNHALSSFLSVSPSLPPPKLPLLSFPSLYPSSIYLSLFLYLLPSVFSPLLP